MLENKSAIFAQKTSNILHTWDYLLHVYRMQDAQLVGIQLILGMQNPLFYLRTSEVVWKLQSPVLFCWHLVADCECPSSSSKIAGGWLVGHL